MNENKLFDSGQIYFVDDQSFYLSLIVSTKISTATLHAPFLKHECQKFYALFGNTWQKWCDMDDTYEPMNYLLSVPVWHRWWNQAFPCWRKDMKGRYTVTNQGLHQQYVFHMNGTGEVIETSFILPWSSHSADSFWTTRFKILMRAMPFFEYFLWVF